MMVIRFDTDAPVVRGWNPDEDLSVNFRRDDSVAGGTTTGPFVLGDMQHTTTVADTVTRSWQWDIATPLGSAQSELVNLSPGLVSITGDRVVSLGTGKAQLRVTSPIGSRDYSLDASIAAGTTYDLSGYQAGSLAANVDALMRSLFLGQTLNNTTAFLSTGWPPNYPANTNRIAPSLDLTPVSLLRQPLGETGWTPLYPDLLISPRHGLVTAHAAGAVGDQVLFRRPDNSLQWVTRIGLRSIGSDTAIVYYDQPVTGITPAKLAPANLSAKLPNLATTTGAGAAWYVPVVHLLANGYPHLNLNPGRKVLVTLLSYSENGSGSERWLWFQRVNGTDFEPYGVSVSSIEGNNDGIRGGDSGSLMAIPIQETNGGPVSLMWTSLNFGPFKGPNFSLLLDAINAEMNAQAGTAPGTYAVGTSNLSRFPNYTSTSSVLAIEQDAIDAARRNNAALWYIPDSFAGVYQDAAGTTPAAAGTPIGRVNDQQYGAANAALGSSALGFLASQSLTGNRPTVTTLANGRPAMSFNGTSAYLNHAITSLLPNSHTIIMALRTSASSGGDRVAHAVRSTSGNAIMGQMYYPSGNVPTYIDRYNGFETANQAFTATNDPHTFSAVTNNPTSRRVWLNGGSGIAMATTTGTATTDKASIGAAWQPTISQFWQGSISLICVSNTAMPDADRIAIERFGAYLAGVTGYT